MEKKRRARINDSLETLKQILLESKTTLKESKNGQRTAKLEKADILEMTVQHLQHLHDKLRLNQTFNTQYVPAKTKKEVLIRPADSSCDSTIKIGIQLLPKKLEDGSIVFLVPSSASQSSSEVLTRQTVTVDDSKNVWRPW